MSRTDSPANPPSAPTDHQRIEQLLPWYAGGQLPEDEQRQVEAHCEACEECRRQLSALTSLRREVRRAGDREPGPSRDLLAATLERIEAEAPRERRARSWLSWWQDTPAPARWALAAQLLLLLGLFAALLLPADRAPVTTAGGGSSPGVSAAGARLQVGFSPDAPAAAVEDALRAVGAEIVAGPSPLGLYTLELTADREPDTVRAALERLREMPGVIDYAEPLPAGSEP